MKNKKKKNIIERLFNNVYEIFSVKFNLPPNGVRRVRYIPGIDNRKQKNKIKKKFINLISLKY